MNKAGKWKIVLIGIALFSVIFTYLFSYTQTTKLVLELCSPYLEAPEITQNFQYSFMQKGGLYDQFGQRLKEKGYNHLILTGINPKKEILVKLVLIDKEANQQRQEKIKEIFNDFLAKNDLDPSVFKVKVSNDESFNW
ncbi:hypothetical protein PB01_09765 [Psychrobacillus glaciei]|uniref:Uncharacterized protein n=1 Tax=Psychrobacillus glaciei TaxID=2283160 RepID=A0A5J6SNQ9_9BACI|nr:hypothetical protein [Psychrobacillus glaciei]QFF99093.1 hypothetical protein PB01_09765 [Psychrobacillus glaciei]